jgi:hypothetical protein
MTKYGNDSDGLGDAHPALWEAKLTKADEHRIRSECFIPKFVKIRFDEAKSGAVVRSDSHEVCLYKTMFKAGPTPFPSSGSRAIPLSKLGPPPNRGQRIEGPLWLHGVVATCAGQGAPVNYKGVPALALSP